MGIVSSIIASVFLIPAALILTSIIEAIIEIDVLTTISNIFSTVGGSLVRSLVLIAIVFQYYNLIERRDGASIINAIDNIGKAKTARSDLREEEF
jgi:uncharacterized membrane protein